jgi:hypothetical protein
MFVCLLHTYRDHYIFRVRKSMFGKHETLFYRSGILKPRVARTFSLVLKSQSNQARIFAYIMPCVYGESIIFVLGSQGQRGSQLWIVHKIFWYLLLQGNIYCRLAVPWYVCPLLVWVLRIIAFVVRSRRIWNSDLNMHLVVDQARCRTHRMMESW